MKRLIVLLSFSMGAVALANCSGDDSETQGAGGSADGSATGGTKDASNDGANHSGGSVADAIVNGQDSTETDTTVDVLTPDGRVDAQADASAACPLQTPPDNTACPNELRGEVCAYGATSCRCRSGLGTWTCATEAGAEAGTTCPAQQPPDTSQCPQALRGDTCSYMNASCECRTTSGNWRCATKDAGTDAAPVTCPAAQPQSGRDCPQALQGDTCNYAAATCDCRQTGRWVCDATDAAPVSCPAAQPQEASRCPQQLQGDTCDYTAATCECRDTLNWRCTPRDAGHDASQVTCPGSQPTSGTGCPPALQGDTCSYAAATCECRDTTGNWRCTAKDAGTDAAPVTCPAAQPQSNDTCPQALRGDTCNYTSENCECRTNGRWRCTAVDAGRDSAALCPATEPDDYASCSSVTTGLTCPYGTVQCRCRTRDNRWWCPALPADAGCPVAAPARNSACQRDLTCPYSGGTCTCNTNTTGRWQCTGDAGVYDAEAD